MILTEKHTATHDTAIFLKLITAAIEISHKHRELFIAAIGADWRRELKGDCYRRFTLAKSGSPRDK